MSDKFADLEESKFRKKLIFGIVIVLFVILVGYRWSKSDWQPLHGKVESVDTSSIADASGSAVQTASVRLSNGSLVVAEVVSGGPLSVGDQVRLVVRPASATGNPYEVIAKMPGSEP